jgi:hypothetical protein
MFEMYQILSDANFKMIILMGRVSTHDPTIAFPGVHVAQHSILYLIFGL